MGEGFSIAGKPGAFMVDFIPALKYVPDSMPGTGWKKVARYYNGASWRTRVLPFEHVRELHVRWALSDPVERPKSNRWISRRVSAEGALLPP